MKGQVDVCNLQPNTAKISHIYQTCIMYKTHTLYARISDNDAQITWIYKKKKHQTLQILNIFKPTVVQKKLSIWKATKSTEKR